MDVTIIGHGSLMSGRGLAFSGALAVRSASIVTLVNCQRGFAKLSRYGDRFATDLQMTAPFLQGRRLALGSLEVASLQHVEGLALTVSLEDACRLSKREGYSPESFRQLADLGSTQGLDLATFLWCVQEDAKHDVVSYRRQLFTLTSYTSPHYIPHPVSLGGTEYALIFLAPGFEGTGAETIISIRQQTNIPTILSLVETWRRKPNEDQISYFLSCLLGGVHGISVHDLLSTVREEPLLAQKMRTLLGEIVIQEPAQFLTATGLRMPDYRQIFGESEAALKRSGLKDFLYGA